MKKCIYLWANARRLTFFGFQENIGKIKSIREIRYIRAIRDKLFTILEELLCGIMIKENVKDGHNCRGGWMQGRVVFCQAE